MATTIGKNSTSKRKGIFEWLFPKRIREARCTECGRPYLEHPDREPMHRIQQGNVELLLYDHRSSFRREYMLRVGVWQKSQDNFTFGQLFSQDDFHHLLVAAIEVVEFVEGCEEVIKKDTAEKMSSRRSHTTKQLEDYGRKEKANS